MYQALAHDGVLRPEGQSIPTSSIEVWSMLDRRCRLIVSTNGVVIASDTNARDLLARGRSLHLRMGRLRTCDPSNQERLDEILTSPCGARHTLVLTKGTAAVVINSLCFTSGCELALALTVKVVDESDAAGFEGLAQAFGLTPAEERIALQLLSGHTAAEIAQEVRISINTVRTHIAKAYAKMDVRCREELWGRCSPYFAA